jgi:hypothetical protein
MKKLYIIQFLHVKIRDRFLSQHLDQDPGKLVRIRIPTEPIGQQIRMLESFTGTYFMYGRSRSRYLISDTKVLPASGMAF